jgi:choline dehydrogenase-like flavoprotein
MSQGSLVSDGTERSTVTTERRQIIVIGSGPGGAVTAATLSEAGFDVLVLEE